MYDLDCEFAVRIFQSIIFGSLYVDNIVCRVICLSMYSKLSPPSFIFAYKSSAMTPNKLSAISPNAVAMITLVVFSNSTSYLHLGLGGSFFL